jgi:hypothetical protein
VFRREDTSQVLQYLDNWEGVVGTSSTALGRKSLRTVRHGGEKVNQNALASARSRSINDGIISIMCTEL